MMKDSENKAPQIDPAERNAYFPSQYSLSQFTSSVSDLSDDEYSDKYQGKAKVLVIATDERYVKTDNGKLFSTGNHPVETLLPMYHLHAAGFDFDIATPSGRMTKFEYWAMPNDDKKVIPFFEKYHEKFLNPLSLPDVVAQLADNDYAAVFIPGGHGALIGLPNDPNVAKVLRWALEKDKFILSICHGPAAFLALRDGDNPLSGYSICAFPDSADKQTPDIGYMPGGLTWFFGKELKEMGLTLVNDEISGKVHSDRKVITGDSPFAANELGKVAAKTLVDYFNKG
ncbi:chaperone Hsp31. Cysteine peptidase. MEROPS family C56 [Rosenbergiella nectarea]|uniref:Chaperone Hsp31. Cysteine peptidase. MEROPS family C56 n=2 Tax=Rosenbergiella nectarea TaxID=988801 RepID=A0A1H9EVR5_9GAMM|nr:chaperone Hsp31. Cysteine peptidase. MEROPS family C56 [Rosenbergiella nectarea]